MGLKDKKRVKFVTLVSGSRMQFEDRLAYSFLLAMSKGMSKARLSKVSGLDRTSTLTRVLARLLSQGMVQKQGHRYLAVPSNLVRLDGDRKAAESWYEHVCYIKYYLPSDSCPLTKKQLAVYYLILAGKTGTSLLATLLGISRPTIIKAMKALKSQGLLDSLGDPVALSDAQLAWWLDKESRNKAIQGGYDNFISRFASLITAFEQCPTEWVQLHFWKSDITKFGNLCEQYGYSCKQVVALLEKATFDDLCGNTVPVARLFRELTKLIKKAEEATERNRRTGSYRGSSFGSFKRKVEDFVRVEKAKNAVEATRTKPGA